MIYEYASVSTGAQDLANQLDQIKAAGCERIFHDNLSGLIKERPQLKRLLKAAALGDTVIIPAIDHLSRDTADLLTIARDMKSAGVGLRSFAEPVIDTTREFSDISLAVPGLAAKREHKRIRERTAIGRAAAKAAGKRLGRAPKLTPDQIKEAIARREAATETLATIGRSYNASASTSSRLKAESAGLMQQTRRLHRQQGIAIGPILFVVAILAVLATAIAAGSSTFSGSTEQEKARVLAAALIDESVQLRMAVLRLLALGCSPAQINFYTDNDTSGNSGANANAPANHACDVFRPEGAGLVFNPILTDVCIPADSRAVTNCYKLVSGHTDSGGNRQLVFIAYYMTDDICNQINALLSTTAAPDDFPSRGVSGFTGTFASSSISSINGCNLIPVGRGSPSHNWFHFIIMLQ